MAKKTPLAPPVGTEAVKVLNGMVPAKGKAVAKDCMKRQRKWV